MNKLQLIYVLLILAITASCSNTKYLSADELLYTGAKLKVEGNEITHKQQKILQDQLEDLIRPKPNSKIFGLRFRLFLYNIVGESKKDKGFRYWLKNKVGEPPVIYKQVDKEYTASVLQNFAENKGYFYAVSIADSTRSGKKVKVFYTVEPKNQYFIRKVLFPDDTIGIGKAVYATSMQSLLKPNQPYSLETIKEERARIDARLKEEGYYYFNPDYLIVEVYKSDEPYKVDLSVKVKREIPELSKVQYKINKIVVYPDYNIGADSIASSSDSIVRYKDFTIVDPDKIFKPQIFDKTLLFKKGDYYNRTNHNLSLNRLVNIGAFKFVKNQFRTADTSGNFLDAYYYLTPLPKKSIRVELLAKTNSANYTGTELNLNWSNRNTFHGAELLTISVFGGMEVQVSGQNDGFNVYRIGTEANLILPGIISPFNFESTSRYIPRTKATLGYEYQDRRKLYVLQTFRASFGYLWKENERKEHQLSITEVTYVSPHNVTNIYKEQIALIPTLSKVIEKHLIFGPTYSYTYTNTMQTKRKNTVYYISTFDIAGNIAGLLTGANSRKNKVIEVFGVPFSQYAKVENEFRNYLKLGTESQLASRIIIGAGFAYGNSEEIPFIKQLFIGGTNSIRAFQARSIGPGTYKMAVDSVYFLPDESGDIKLELNTEFRFGIYRFFKGALFIDAGNIWLLNDNKDKPGSGFSNDFLNEIAIGTGIGFRFDFSFLVLRADFAFPVRKPHLPDGQRLVLDEIDFGKRSWRKENLVFNLAIGYPF